MADAKEHEARGLRLVYSEYVNAYRSAIDGDWWLDAVRVRDWNTGELLYAYDPFEEEPEFDYSTAFLVEQRIVEG